jgi:glycosyltransferase involved in cell wall biosynthesis
MDIICLSTTDWDEIWGSRQQIMSRLASDGHRILFVERQVSPEQILRAPDRYWKRKRSSIFTGQIRQIHENIWLSSPPLTPPGRYYFHFLNKVGQRNLAHDLAQPIAKLGFQHYILWLYPPQSAPLIPYLKPDLVVYHCIDYFPAGILGRKRTVLQQQEDQLLDNADCIFVNSRGLIEELKKRTHKNLILIPSAVDVDHFQQTDGIHVDLSTIPHPRVGFSGTLDARFDSTLVESIARSRPDWQIILLGDQRPGFKNSVILHSLSNIHFMGKKPYQELPFWFNGFDVLMIPYVQSERTFYISPLKFYEYLATGKPIITVPLPEIMDYQPHISLARSPVEFIHAIDSAIASSSPSDMEKRRQIAKMNTWRNRIDAMLSAIQDRLKQPNDQG